MKVNFLRKAKWYIVAFILAAVMLSVSLSFCVWDTLNTKASLTGKGGHFARYGLVHDMGYIDIADVGDVVTFGKYYQQANTTTKTDIRWLVVEKDSTQLTLLAENVMAFGSFWGTRYYTGSNWGSGPNNSCYQNYSQSAVRAWLNSSNTRTDGGTPIEPGSENGVVFKGFLSEAFTAEEQSWLLPKTISGIMGYGKDNYPNTPTQAYATVTDKVWLPSWSEVYGTTATPWGETLDGSPNKRFSYFKDTAYGSINLILSGRTTAFASSQYSNYTMTGATSPPNHQDITVGGYVHWWLRSPTPLFDKAALGVNADGSGTNYSTNLSYGGVRPVICIQP